MKEKKDSDQVIKVASQGDVDNLHNMRRPDTVVVINSPEYERIVLREMPKDVEVVITGRSVVDVFDDIFVEVMDKANVYLHKGARACFYDSSTGVVFTGTGKAVFNDESRGLVFFQATVRARDSASVEVFDRGTVYAEGESSIVLNGESRVYADGSVDIVAKDLSVVYATRYNSIFATDNATVHAYSGGKCECEGNARCIQHREDIDVTAESTLAEEGFEGETGEFV